MILTEEEIWQKSRAVFHYRTGTRSFGKLLWVEIVKYKTEHFKIYFTFLVVAGLKLRVSHLLGRCLPLEPHLQPPSSPFCPGYFGDRVSPFAHTGLDCDTLILGFPL
jgi:hypothetical protein